MRELGALLSEPFGGFLGGVRLTGGGWVEGVSGLSFTTTSTNAAWTPTTVTKTGPFPLSGRWNCLLRPP